ncbi:hypothetical protein TNCT_403191 [Trichonephila clavata]|uniref:Uncharacterized protein n=1 Tax=Trichonephila clavata TaxID=2740835 RepID=A0A8X6LTZ0_TRICU|nr:hypothetical protein TNCT_403191 [Trichonephila clavata]
MDSRIPSAERKCIHPQQNSGLKLSMNILRTLMSNTGFHTTRRSLDSLRHPHSFRERYREKIFYPSRHRGFRFPAVQHTPCLLDYKNASNLSMDLLRHFKTQWILTKQGNVPGRSFEKSLYQSRPLQDQVPRFDIRATFSEPLPRSHSLFNKAVF